MHSTFRQTVLQDSLSFRLKNIGRSIKEIIDILEVKRSTLYYWFKQGIKEHHQYYRQSSKQNIEKQVLEIIQNYPTDSIRKITYKVNLLLNTPVSLWTVFRSIKQIGFTHKKVYKIGTSKDMCKIISSRTNFSNEFINIPIDKLLFLDETSVYDLASANKAWTPKGTRFHLPMDRARSKRKTLITAFGMFGFELSKCLKETCNGIRFASYFEELLQNMKGKYTHVLMDNAAIHKTKLIQSLFKKYNMTPVYTSPYSPEWNPVEMFFSYLKRTNEYLNDRHVCIENKLNIIINKATQLCKKWVVHVQRDILANHHR